MKKIFALVLALSLVACLALSASAITPANGSLTGEVSISLKNDSTSTETAETVYNVDVAWANTAFTFTYTNAENSELKWDPASHTYTVETEDDVAAEGTWSTNDPITATVTNHSNADITATLSGVTEQNGVEFGFDASAQTIARADQGESLGDRSQAPKHVFEIAVSGTPEGSFTVDFTLTID